MGPDNNIQLVQVCAKLSNQDTLEREKRSLVEAMKELNQSTCTIECDGKIINIVPAWKYLLQLLS